MRTLFTFLVVILFANLAISQNLESVFEEFGKDKETVFTDHNFKGTRLVNSQSVNLLEDGVLLVLIQHRFGNTNSGFYELFGLDQAEMRLGFDYGLSKNVLIGFGRSTYQKTYDLYFKTALLRQSNEFPFSATASASAFLTTLRNYFPTTNNDFSDRLSHLVQLHLATTTKRFSFQISPGYLTTGFIPEIGEDQNFFMVGSTATAAISKRISLNLEYIHHFNERFFENKRPLSLGVDIETGGHLFQLIFSNSQSMNDKGLFTNSKGNWKSGDFFFGFNLIRIFYTKKKNFK